jgi:hypothetical protein
MDQLSGSSVYGGEVDQFRSPKVDGVGDESRIAALCAELGHVAGQLADFGVNPRQVGRRRRRRLRRRRLCRSRGDQCAQDERGCLDWFHHAHGL